MLHQGEVEITEPDTQRYEHQGSAAEGEGNRETTEDEQ